MNLANAYLAVVMIFFSSWAHAIVKPYPWIRLDGEANNLRLSPNGKYAVFTNADGFDLSLLELESKKVYLISPMKVGHSFFFSPDGYRIFFRELVKTEDKPVVSVIKAIDAHNKNLVEIARVPGPSGFITFDPRDMRLQLMHEKGILSKMIVFPDERLAKWQLAQRTDQGKWLVAPHGMLWLTHSGFTLTELKDDGSGIQSFDIAPDGSHAVWATNEGGIFASEQGQPPVRIGDGFDPKWHPQKLLVVYAGARKIGSKIISTDLRLVDLRGHGRWITNDPETSERWPQWLNFGKSIAYSISKTTDIYRIEME